MKKWHKIFSSFFSFIQNKVFSVFSVWARRKSATFIDYWQWAPWRRKYIHVRSLSRPQVAASSTNNKSNVITTWLNWWSSTRESSFRKEKQARKSYVSTFQFIDCPNQINQFVQYQICLVTNSWHTCWTNIRK